MVMYQDSEHVSVIINKRIFPSLGQHAVSIAPVTQQRQPNVNTFVVPSPNRILQCKRGTIIGVGLRGHGSAAFDLSTLRPVTEHRELKNGMPTSSTLSRDCLRAERHQVTSQFYGFKSW
jgi:hypothetical protein